MKLSSTLPKGDRNGLEPRIPVLINDPEALHVAIVIVRTSKITQNIETGEHDPQVKILRIECVLPADATQAEKLMRRALEHRQGVTTLPIDLEDEITAAFSEAAIDRTTSEVIDDGDVK